MNAEDKLILESTNSPEGSVIVDMGAIVFVERPDGSVSEQWFLDDCKHSAHEEDCAECEKSDKARNEARNKYWNNKKD